MFQGLSARLGRLAYKDLQAYEELRAHRARPGRKALQASTAHAAQQASTATLGPWAPPA